MALVLASKSPRRRQLMRLVTPVYQLDEAALDENGVAAETPALLAGAIALAKAQLVAARRPQDVVLGCDTVVEVDGAAMGKPHGPAQAADMLRALAGRQHLVHTGLAVLAPGRHAPLQHLETTAVCFAPISKEDLQAYIATEEPYDKAGGYGIQGWAARYVQRIEGCYYNVLGLPVAALYRLLRENELLP